MCSSAYRRGEKGQNEMVFPIGDDNTGRSTTPPVTYVLIAANVLAFVLFRGLGAEGNRFTYARATAPREIVTGRAGRGLPS